jgi:hypothetical protein
VHPLAAGRGLIDPSHSTRRWLRAAFHGVPVASFVLALYVYWFGFANRHIVFLYYHPMGPRILDTSPFSRVTSSRYWMAGLVASGALLALDSGISWALRRLSPGYVAPAWWQVWMIAGGLLTLGIPAITMTVGSPALPPLEAAKTTGSAIAGIGLACASGAWAAGRPRELLWLTLDGLSVMLVILVGSVFYFPLTRAGLSHGQAVGALPLAGLVAAALSLAALTGLRRWRRVAHSSARSIFASGLVLAYLLMPLLHHVAFTDGYYYVTSSDNFFYQPWGRQAAGWFLAAALAVGTKRVRARIGDPRALAQPEPVA